MSTALAEVTTHRTWFVPHLMVYGLPSLGELEYLIFEAAPASSVLFGSTEIGDAAQQVNFADLTDHRGNKLPASISRPKVILRPRDLTNMFVVGDETDQGFKIARDPNVPGPVMADLMIIEMGL